MSTATSPFAPKAIDGAAIQARYDVLAAALPAPDAIADTWEAWFWDWNALRIEISGEGSRRYMRECQDTRDEAIAADWRYMREVVLPISEDGDGRLRAAFVAATCRPELEKRLGAQLFARLDLDTASFAPENVALHMEEMELVSQYDRVGGTAAIPMGDETLTLSQVNGRLTNPDATKRRQAWQGLGTWSASQAAGIHGILSQLITLRDRQARQLGDTNFIPLAYRRMGRTEYGPEQIAVFRQAIRDHVVPLAKAVRTQQAIGLGAGALVPAADMMYFPNATLGPDSAPVAEQLTRAGELFSRLHPTFAKHFSRMVAEGLIDLENRPGKKPGAFAMSMEDEERVAIFCNSTGAESDVTTLTHEMGHAIQGWESMPIRPLDLRLPTMDAAEVHSFGMEYLAFRALEAFFSPEDAAHFRRLRLTSTLTRLPYMAMVDSFQHWLYTNPGHTPAEREAAWARDWEAYMPGLDFVDCPEQRQYRWMRQAHIFASPFYYIDYALAEVSALQIWRLSTQDHQAATDAYLELCRLGGSQPMLSLLKAVNLTSPFDADELASLMTLVRSELGL